jgi:hypothetical protein
MDDVEAARRGWIHANSLLAELRRLHGEAYRRQGEAFTAGKVAEEREAGAAIAAFMAVQTAIVTLTH